MPDENQNSSQQERIEISEEMVQEFIEEVIKLEQDNLHINRANLKEQIVSIAKTKVR